MPDNIKDKVVTLEDLKAAQIAVRPDWEQSDENAPDYIKNRPIEEVEMEIGEDVHKELLHTYDHIDETQGHQEGGSITETIEVTDSNNTFYPLDDNPTDMSLSINGLNVYQGELIQHPMYGIFYIGNLSLASGSSSDDTGENYLAYAVPQQQSWNVFYYYGEDYSEDNAVDSVTISTYKTVKTVVVGDVNKINKDLLYNPDWNDNNNSSPSFIKNRPFYLENGSEEVTCVLYESVLYAVNDEIDHHSESYALRFELTDNLSDDLAYIKNCESVKLVIGDNTLTLNNIDCAPPYDIAFGNLGLADSYYGPDSGESACITASSTYNIISIFVRDTFDKGIFLTDFVKIIYEKPIVKTISEQYIPDINKKYNTFFDCKPFFIDRSTASPTASSSANVHALYFNISQGDIHNYYNSSSSYGSFIPRFVRIYNNEQNFCYLTDEMHVKSVNGYDYYTIYYSKNISKDMLDSFFTNSYYNQLDLNYIDDLDDFDDFLNYKVIIVVVGKEQTTSVRIFFITNENAIVSNNYKIAFYADTVYRLSDKYREPAYWDAIVNKPFGTDTEQNLSCSLSLSKTINEYTDENKIEFETIGSSDYDANFSNFIDGYQFYYTVGGLLKNGMLIEGVSNNITYGTDGNGAYYSISDYIYDSTGNKNISNFGSIYLQVRIYEDNTIRWPSARIRIENNDYLDFNIYEDFSVIDTISIKIYAEKQKVKKIDPIYLPDTLPEVSSVDSGKFLRVDSNGNWSVESVPNAEGSEF